MKEVKSTSQELSQNAVTSNAINSYAVTTSTGWHYVTSWKGSRSLDVTGISAIAGILASICGGPVTGVIVTIATSIARKHLMFGT